MKKINLLLLHVVLLPCPPLLMAESIPQSLATDARIKTVNYDANNVVLLKSRYGYQTQIVFAADEIIQNVSMGDSLAWQAVPVNNHLFIKPTASSLTNMTVLTTAHSYTFHLDSQDVNVSPIYRLQFNYQTKPFIQTQEPIAHLNPQTLNWNYSYTGDTTLAPIKAFDDGKFTYLKFRDDGYQRLPAFFSVDRKRNETLVNYHLQEGYLVIHRVAKQFSLRHQNSVTSLYNDTAIGETH